MQLTSNNNIQYFNNNNKYSMKAHHVLAYLVPFVSSISAIIK